jgi:hypothetical protein
MVGATVGMGSHGPLEGALGGRRRQQLNAALVRPANGSPADHPHNGPHSPRAGNPGGLTTAGRPCASGLPRPRVPGISTPSAATARPATGDVYNDPASQPRR